MGGNPGCFRGSSVHQWLTTILAEDIEELLNIAQLKQFLELQSTDGLR